MAGTFRGSCRTLALSLLMTAVLPAPVSCGGDDDGGSKGPTGKPDASTDAPINPGDSSVSSEGSADSASDGAIEQDAGNDVEEAQAPIDAEDAAYTIELGSQIDELLTSQHPGNAAVTYEMVSTPTIGELLHFDSKTGRFVYTSITEGTDTFDFRILDNGQQVDTATITVTTKPLDFVGDWHLNPGGSCADYDFKVAQTDAGTFTISPLVSACIKQASGMSSIPLGGTSTQTHLAQSLGVVECVNDIAGVNYCYAFRFWRISSRDDFQSIETVSGTKTVGGQPYLISGQVRGVVRRSGDTTEQRAAVAGQATTIVQVGTSDGTPKTYTLTLENKGNLAATLGNIGLPTQATLEGGYPGTGGTCAATLDPGKTCTVMLLVTPTAPATGDTESVPLSVYFSDTAGYDISRLSINWTWKTP